MFFSSEDDDQDFLMHGGSKLASVFGMDKANSQGGNESLTYTAPKQPKQPRSKDTSPEGGSASDTAVPFAVVVQVYKFVDNQYVSQGKVGAAILANHLGNEYRLLLYINKQTHLTNARILPTFTFNIQQNNYANFYDDSRINWSIMFNNSQDAEKFAKEVGLAKALATGGRLDKVVQQELQLGEGGGLEAGDSAEVRYTGWLLTNSTFGQVFDSNANSDKPLRFKVGKGKVIKGWDTGMLGMRKGSKRLLVIPPIMAYGTQGLGDRIPPNSTLIFEVEVLRVKLQKGETTPEQSATPTVPSPGPSVLLPDVPYVDHDDSVKERSRSLTEQLTQSPASDKARLISRMAKMGQPMLPAMLGAVQAQQDSEDEMPPTQSAFPKPPLPAKPQVASHPHQMQSHLLQQPVSMMEQPIGHTQPYIQVTQPLNPSMIGGMPIVAPPVSQPTFLQNLPGSQQLSVYQPPPSLLQQQQQAMLAMQQQQQQQQMPGFNLTSPQTSGLLGQASHLTDPMTPILLTETRQQSTELRLAVSKLSDKVDRIMEKMEGLSSGVMQLQPLPAPSMETTILLHNISRIIQENERLKKDVFERGEKIESQNEKIAELLQKNQKFVEKSNIMLEERNEGYKMTANQAQGRILALEQEKVQLATDFSLASSRIASLQLELGELRKTEGELRQRLQSNTSSSTEQREELERLRLQRAEDEKKLTDLSSLLREEKTARKQTEGQVTALQEELADIRTTCGNHERTLNERKRKAAEEKKKLEEEVEEIKAGYERDLQSLREKLKKQRATTDVETADRVTKLEEELASEWQSKCDKLLATASDKHERQLAAVKEDLKEAQDKSAGLEAKVQELRATANSSEIKVAGLQQQLEETLPFKDKYENLRNQATAMKQKYEDRIGELEDETETLTSRIQDLQQQLLQARQQLQQQQEQLQQQQQRLQQAVLPPSTSTGSGGDVASEVKKIMNSVYQSLRKEFEADETYLGSEIMATVLSVIKETTLKLVQQQTSTPAQNGKNEEVESDEDEEVEEEEEEEEEEEDAQEEEEEEENDAQEEEEEENEDEPLAVEETFLESTDALTQAAVPSSQQSPITGEEAEEPVTAVHSYVAGDRGNPYYTQKLDNSSVEDSLTLTASRYHMTGDKGNPYYTQELDVSSLVEEAVMPASYHETGDKGNPYYSQKLDASTSVEEVVTPALYHMTGDKGNLYYSKELDGSTSVEKPLTAITGHMMGDRGNPYHSQKLDKSSPGGEKSQESPEGSFQSVNSIPDVDLQEVDTAKREEPDSAKTLEPDTTRSEEHSVDEDSEEETTRIINVDDNRTQREQTVDALAPEADQHPHEESSMLAQDEPHTVPEAADDILSELLEPRQRMTSHPLMTSQSEQEDLEDDSLFREIKKPEPARQTLHRQAKEMTGTSRTSSTTSEDSRERAGSVSVVPALVSREPPPLFDDNEDGDSPLFGADSTVADTFGTHFLPTDTGDSSKKEKEPDKKPATSSKLPSKADLTMEDDTKPKPPPPLFGDDDDDDLDWLS